jgi:hypothetical protein
MTHPIEAAPQREHIIRTGGNSRVTVKSATEQTRGKIRLESTIGGSSIILELTDDAAQEIAEALLAESGARID